MLRKGRVSGYGLLTMDKNIPNHVAIIPDGNRRWARARGKNAYYGHKRGVALFEEVAMYGFDAGVKHLSVWGMSIDNMKKRSKTEVAGLMSIFKREFDGLVKSEEIYARRIKVNIFGRWEEKFPKLVKKPMWGVIEATKNYKERTLNFFLVYNGRDEMLQAVQSIIEKERSEKSITKVTHKIIRDNLYTKSLPPVDMVIRTAGDPHLSNGFMMWDVADAELYFTNKMWPDFNKREFNKALESYSNRRRRLGS